MEVRVVDQGADLAGATLVIGVLEGMEAAPGSQDAFARVDPDVIAVSRFEAKPSETLLVPFPDAHAAILVGLGGEVTFERIRAASGAAVRQARTERLVSLLAGIGVDQATRAVTEGSLLGGYQFREYKTNGEKLKVESVDIVGGVVEEMEEADVVAGLTNRARAWVNTPAKDMSPDIMAAEIEELAATASIDVEVWDRTRIEEEGLGALLGVAAGSDREPRVVIMTYRPDDARTHLGLVGKGIMFDTGGLSIKSAGFMEEMKGDMAGAATVAAATVGIARLGLPLAVTCVIPMTDNAIGGDATRPGDILRPVEGPSIEVLNTDAEGRLILADGLGLVRRYDPDTIIDVATLTGASRTALGDKITALFSSDRDLAARVLAAASRAGEHFWEMPLFADYRKSIDSNVADIKNVSGSRYGGAIVAALFLAEYVGDTPWAHLDIAGPSLIRESSGEMTKGASGVGVRTLVELAISSSSGEPS